MKINLIEYFEESVKERPDRIAVIEGNERLSFVALKNRSVQISNRIVAALNGIQNRPIAVFLSKSINSVCANIAITYSGNFYMNLDVKSPNTRIKNILDLIKPVIVITNTGNLNKLSDIPKSIKLLNIDDITIGNNDDSTSLIKRLKSIIDTDPVCIINTSGSTGTPKGVVLNHRSFFDFTEWAVETLHIGNNEIIGSLSPLVFDIYSFEVILLMAKGSTMVLIPENLSAFPANIIKMMQETKVSFIFWVPTIMVNIANMDLLSRMQLPDLKTVWFAGEVFPTKQFNYWKKNISSAKFINLYGPIEITLDCTYYIIERELRDDEPIPIGFPCRNTDILILNDENKIASVNEHGELCVRGTSLAMGYYNNPEKTNAAFVQNPLNNSYPELIYRTGDIVYVNNSGEIIFKGRKDSMVKHLGYRIELGEVEHVIINTLKLVNNGCVVYDFTKREIVLFYESDKELDIAQTRTQIGTVFPKYMMPSIFLKMDELPRNTNGKIDRLYLNTQINS